MEDNVCPKPHQNTLKQQVQKLSQNITKRRIVKMGTTAIEIVVLFVGST